MEGSFRDRVDKTFASILPPSSSSSSSMSSLWSLTVDEIEPTLETELERRDDPLFAPRDNMEKDLEEFDDEDDEIEEDEDKENKAIIKPEDYNDEEWEIKSSIGLDCTLDYEEEEDGYDKVAVGKEAIKDVDRLYMKEVNDYEIDADQPEELPLSIKGYSKDPRANHMAAKIKLSQDAKATTANDDNVGECGNLKSILKRKDNKTRPEGNLAEKRVRFDAECKADGGDEVVPNLMEEDKVSDDSFKLPPDYPRGIPDYMRNPSKYTRYTFESSDVDEVSNRQAYMDFLNLMKKPNATESETMVELPKSVAFVPKRKVNDSMVVENLQNKENKGLTFRDNPLVSIAVEDDQVCEMEEDEPETIADRRSSSQKSNRQYRVKSIAESDEQS
ncbi:hypothetical protein ACFE04_023606 [Oxalis oulophora]